MVKMEHPKFRLLRPLLLASYDLSLAIPLLKYPMIQNRMNKRQINERLLQSTLSHQLRLCVLLRHLSLICLLLV